MKRAMTPMYDREASDRRLFGMIGDFLFAHGLEPSAANYMLVHMLITRSDAEAVTLIEQATSDGVRLTQREADRILHTIGSRQRARDTIPDPRDPLEEAGRQMATFAELVEITRAATNDYGRDLESSAAALSAAVGSPSIASLIHITSAMIAHTRATEARLEQATSEAEGLRAKLGEALEDARRDPLTGLLNRRAFQHAHQALVESGSPHTVAICDLDHFKRINDTHGHIVGDRVLKAVAQILQTTCNGHLVARYGGEEFVVLMTDCSPDEGVRVIEEARDGVAERHFRVRDTDAPIGTVTFSAGIAYSPGDDGADAVKRADQLLYAAKAAGRNHIAVDRSA